MNLKTVSQQARLKGLDIVGTGDIFHPEWMESVEEELVRVEEGTFEHPEYKTRFLLTAEVEDSKRVHHLILFPSISIVREVGERFMKDSPSLKLDGRPRLRLSAPEIAEIVVEQGCLIGPAHAFTPWTSVYKEFDSLVECYMDMRAKVSFLELGLSADTSMADRISELSDLTFLSNSDSHSPWPDKLGREFNRFELASPSFEEVRRAIERRAGRRVELNVGFDPRLGKYHRTACARCFKQFGLMDAENLGWKCDRCGGMIKKGVLDRINELADRSEPVHPAHRPPYLRVAPLAEIIALAVGEGTDTHHPEVQKVWAKLVRRFGNEIRVLVDVPPGEIESVGGSGIAVLVEAFRNQELKVIDGGGGRYGRLEVPSELLVHHPKRVQRRLTEFG